MKLRLIVEKDPETGRYSSVFPELPGCASAGDTEDEAIANAEKRWSCGLNQPNDSCNSFRIAAMAMPDPRVARHSSAYLGYFISGFQRDEEPVQNRER